MEKDPVEQQNPRKRKTNKKQRIEMRNLQKKEVLAENSEIYNETKGEAWLWLMK